MAHEKLQQIANDFFNEHEHVYKLNLSSLDGLSLFSHQRAGSDYETDRISAVSSSLASLCQATANQLLDSDLLDVILESKHGNMLIIQTMYQDEPAILSIIANEKFNIGQIKLYTKALVQSISAHTSLKPMAKILKFAIVS